ncbi:hypothetical protein [Demequina subtropica]|uniref:hypothetical protein n=1 Tax=Demequina subtropica TaxID=1638989 RepID=UPI0012DFFFD8|nr:hypothetical protein [Demequina subtropica]
MERFAPSRAKAEAALRSALLTIDVERGGGLKSSTSLRELGAMFLQAKREAGRAEGTLETYGYAVNAHIVTSLGDLSVAEAKPERLQ